MVDTRSGTWWTCASMVDGARTGGRVVAGRRGRGGASATGGAAAARRRRGGEVALRPMPTWQKWASNTPVRGGRARRHRLAVERLADPRQPAAEADLARAAHPPHGASSGADSIGG